MTFTFRPAIRENAATLIALAGPSGSGKTFTALRLARGLAGDGKIAFIDTEAGRGLHYADQFSYDHGDLRAPFRPGAYQDAILAAEAAGYSVVIVDSFSHEYEGEGGLFDWADELAAKGVKAPLNWSEPKMAHKRLVGRMLQMRCHLIFCLRAEEKIKVDRQQIDGRFKTVIIPLGWMPLCEKRFMYEMTTSFTLAPDSPGEPRFDLPHKLQEQHRPFFPAGQKIGEDAGKALAAWAHGATEPKAPEPSKKITLPDELRPKATAIMKAIRGAETQEALDRILAVQGETLAAIKTASEEAYDALMSAARKREFEGAAA